MLGKSTKNCLNSLQLFMGHSAHAKWFGNEFAMNEMNLFKIIGPTAVCGKISILCFTLRTEYP